MCVLCIASCAKRCWFQTGFPKTPPALTLVFYCSVKVTSHCTDKQQPIPTLCQVWSYQCVTPVGIWWCWHTVVIVCFGRHSLVHCEFWKTGSLFPSQTGN